MLRCSGKAERISLRARPGNLARAPTKKWARTPLRSLRCLRMIGPQILARYAAVLMLAAAAGATCGARPAVVELYTSQGCSSCPPADALLGEIAKRADVLALAFHVDYWDDLGWRDPFSLPEARQRQLNYVRHFGQDWVYTPDIVIDGHVDVLGVDRNDLLRRLIAPRTGVPVHVAVQGEELIVSVEAASGATVNDVILVSYKPTAVTAIGRGENAGRELREFNIVRSFATLGLWQGAAAEWRVPLKSLPADAAKVAVLVQQPGPGPIVGAVSAALPVTAKP